MKMYNNITNDKTIDMAYYIIENQTTIRATAKVFNIPKSTVHYLFNNKLKYINYNLYKEVKTLLENNFQTKHIHGGEATKLKYQKLKNEINTYDEKEFSI